MKKPSNRSEKDLRVSVSIAQPEKPEAKKKQLKKIVWVLGA